VADRPPPPPRGAEEQHLSETVARRAERKLAARRRRPRTAWFGLGMFGLVGWSVSVPALIGIALGLWLDHRYPGQVSWTLTFLIIGLALGCLNAWYWIKQESERD
jgi:ATP synthase protein I